MSFKVYSVTGYYKKMCVYDVRKHKVDVRLTSSQITNIPSVALSVVCLGQIYTIIQLKKIYSRCIVVHFSLKFMVTSCNESMEREADIMQTYACEEYNIEMLHLDIMYTVFIIKLSDCI